MIGLNKLREKFGALTAREKLFVSATVIVGLWSGWDAWLWSPLNKQQQLLQQELANLDQQIALFRQTTVKLGNKNANPSINNKLAALNAEFTRLHNLLVQAGEKFVPPRLMVKALNDLLNQNQHLTLVKLDTLPASPLRTEKNQFFPIYKHELALTFSGNYFDTLVYLKALESLSWRINWNSIDYQVGHHPIAETTIRAYTLSFEESWLGV